MTAKKESHADAIVQRQPNPRQRILVVEDDEMIRRGNTQVLTCSGYQVDAAEDGAAAWEAVQLNNYDLVVTDNHMPKVTGIELIRKLQDAGLDLPVIMVTGTLPADEFTRCPWLQPDIVLIKPHTFDELLIAVKTVLRAASSARNEIAPPPNWEIQPLTDRLDL